ncbi:HAMP domain-containing sensor histidine kinase [Desulfolutivibrio sulfoxidireducens]|uniref:HAMP domain-containing sensor histidine kinase n=1 Tax=Desulfolutivibrio sulfoxidireducens TaxID=2773299 RepID=UPI00159E6CE0|nr:HAMP domain-containing sensor histidine kinase [Desulfolutivibrio sulfoxidireducens]QLA16522.1 HAMP domain-containing protein [Desulfolutivibrio sulfoxidireducens]QLA19600.1 HAMP domain-containing protein [Desulfolutivibrio sulfoxidireducens]
MNPFRHSLGVKIAAVAFAATLLVFAGIFVVDFSWYQDNLLLELKASSDFSAELLQMAVEEPMKKGDDAATIRQFENLSQYGHLALFLTDAKGTVTYSNRQSALRRHVAGLIPPGSFKDMLDLGLTRPLDHSALLHIDGAPYFAEVKTVQNAPSCHHCHGASRPILGAVVMLQNVSGQYARLTQFHFRRTAFLFLGLAALLAGLLYYIHRVFITRVGTITQKTEEVTGGNLDVRFDVGGSDELSRLSEHLTTMVAGRKRAEGKLAGLNRDLEKLVARRTRDLARKAAELETANRRLVELDRMKTVFLSTVSHEFKTPLTAVLGFARLMARRFHRDILPETLGRRDDFGRSAAQIAENLPIMIEEGERLAELIDKVIDLTDLESGSVEWKMAPMDLGRTAARAVENVRQTARAKNLALTLEADDGPYDMRGDQDRLTAALGHLLKNAVAFTTEGGVTCRVRRVDDELAVDVIDTGRGISPVDQEAIFETFRQLGDHLTDKPGGTGLGLAIARAVARGHGGRITVQSVPGQGSVFTLSVPLTPPAPDELDQTREAP